MLIKILLSMICRDEEGEREREEEGGREGRK